MRALPLQAPRSRAPPSHTQPPPRSAKFHADISPVGGHDGYAFPGGGGDFHFLHHQKFDCNYGVPLIDFDFLFGSWVDYACFKEAGSDLAKGRELTYSRFGWLGKKEKQT